MSLRRVLLAAAAIDLAVSTVMFLRDLRRAVHR